MWQENLLSSNGRASSTLARATINKVINKVIKTLSILLKKKYNIMDLQELRYLLDYAKRHNMMHEPVASVYQAWSKELEEAYK